MSSYDPDEWLRPPRAVGAGGVLGQPAAEERPQPDPAATMNRSVDLLSPEHRDKLVTMFRWVAEGRTWDEVQGDVRQLFGVSGQRQPPAEPGTERDART